MVHYVKTMQGDTLVAAYGAEFDLNVLITLASFSKLLFTIPKTRRDEFIEDFEQVQDMRNEWFEDPLFQESAADIFLETRLKAIAEKWNLYYQTDRPLATPRPEETPFQADTFRGEVSRRVHMNPTTNRPGRQGRLEREGRPTSRQGSYGEGSIQFPPTPLGGNPLEGPEYDVGHEDTGD